jgi:Undecaprenyl-phosphate glucose phosphotransferase
LTVTGVALIGVAFLTKTSEEYSRAWFVLWMLLAFAGLVGTRGGFHLLLNRLRPTTRSGWLRRNVAIVGTGPEAARFIAHLQSVGDLSTRIIGLYDDRCQRSTTVADHPVRGKIADLCRLSRHVAIDKIYIAMPWSEEDELLRVFQQLDCLPIDIRLVVPPIGYRMLNRPVSYVHQLPVVHVADRPFGNWSCLLKWLEDRVVAALALLLFAPLMALVALAIKIDSPGPVLFRQKRYGFNNCLIEVLKFRTMRHDLADPNATVLTRRDDPRVTRLGHFLRRSSLDELPQLINVLRGEMSIVGPRPHAIEAKAADRLYQDIVAGYAARHKVKPGITGWAQVNGWRGNTETEAQIQKRVEHDLFYLENWSLMFDFKIIMMTIFLGFGGRNAY